MTGQLQLKNVDPTTRYNEVVLDATAFNNNLPDAVEAIFFIGIGSNMHCESSNHWANVRAGQMTNHCESYARVAHEHFLQRFGLDPEQVPLLRLDVDTRTTEPFSPADGGGPDPVATSRSGDKIRQICLSDLAASDVDANGLGYPTQLWVYEGQGSTHPKKTLMTTSSSSAPRWPDEIVCVSLAPRADRRTCFDIRYTNPRSKETEPDILHFGCTMLTANSIGAAYMAVELKEYNKGSKHAVVHFIVHHSMPPVPPRPPPPPAAPPMPCDSPWCETFSSWVRTPDSKFMRMWGIQSWHYREPGERGCWTRLGGRSFFDEVLSGSRCDRNWLEGAVGGEKDRPRFTSGAPALLGFDSTIWEFCSNSLGKNLGGFGQKELGSRCVHSNNNILRILAGSWGWNMCQNFAWQLCAATGKLPGQDSRRSLRFASAPKTLTIQEWEQPTSWPCEHGCPEGKYSVGDVFYTELAVYRTICKNAGELFRLDVGAAMTCELDVDAYWDLVESLLSSYR